MRVTKKMLRDTKRAAVSRIAELCRLEHPTLLKAEYKRCFPHRNQDDSLSIAQMRNELFQDMLDLTIPDHWYE